MKVFSEELIRRREERRQKRSSTWSGLLIKAAALILIILLIRFMVGTDGKRFGNYWKEIWNHSSVELIND